MAQLPYMNPLQPQQQPGPTPLPTPGAAAFPGAGMAGAARGAGMTPREGQVATTKRLVRSRPDIMADPFMYQRQAQQMLHADPRYAYWQNQMMDQQQQFEEANRRFGRDIGSKMGMMRQADVAAQALGRAQAQQARGDIAKQGAMASRGAMSPAAVRQSMMLQSQVGANMAAQIAAQRQQAQQEAQRSYLAARQQNLQNMQSGFGMQQAGAQQQLQEFGGLAQIGSTPWANIVSGIEGLEF